MPKYFYPAILLAVLCSCKKPYFPDVKQSATNALVVEGVIIANGDSTKIRLARTKDIADTTTINPELGATVTIESNQNTSYPLIGDNAGNYVSTGLNLNAANQYRVKIITKGKTYLSDFVPVNITPPIDSVGFYPAATGLQIYANTHDATNNTRYYRWDFVETYQFHPLYQSSLVSNGLSLVDRREPREVYDCWKTLPSVNVITGTSAALTKDEIYQAPISLIPSTSEKLETRYSILLKQYAITKDAYNFWQLIKKNTESLGSIFDAQPSAVTGNVHNSADPAEPVIGYISCSTVQTKRIFIDNSQVPSNWAVKYPYTCELDSFRTADQGESIKIFLINLPVLQTTVRGVPARQGSGYIAYKYSSRQCADCTVRGSHTKPSFWK